MTKAATASLAKPEEFSPTSQQQKQQLNTVEVFLENTKSNSSGSDSSSSQQTNKTNGQNRLDRDRVSLSYDSNNVDMSLLSTVHVCAAQVRRLELKLGLFLPGWDTRKP